MDLRGFGPGNQGCPWVLSQLQTSVFMKQVLFVIDDTTDQRFLTQMLLALWKQVPFSSPNLREHHPTVNPITYDYQL